MKKLTITFSLLIVAIGSFAQPIIKVKSKVLSDSIFMYRGGFEVTGIIVDTNGDTARSCSYSLTFYRDTLGSGNVFLNYYDKKANFLTQDLLPFAQSGYPDWIAFLTPLDAFVHTKRPRVIKH
jgi:hypothetical protein